MKHFQRTAYDSASGRASKRTDHVAFPDELDMERYAFASQALRAQELERRSRNECWVNSFSYSIPTLYEVNDYNLLRNFDSQFLNVRN